MLKFLIWITIPAFTLGNLGQLFRESGLNLYLFDLIIIGANLYLLLFFIKKQKFYINSPLILFLFFSIFSLIVTLFQIKGFAVYEQLYTLSFWIRFNLYFMFGYFLFNLKKFNFIDGYILKKVLVYNLYLLISLNFIQYFWVRDISFMSIYGFDPHTHRLVGFFLDPNFMGFYLVLYLYLNEIYLRKKFLSFLILVQIVLTDSRSAFLTLLLFLILYLFYNFKKTILLSFFTLLLFVFSNLESRFNHISASNDSSSLRILSWTNALLLYDLGPNFGVGFNNYRNHLIGLNLVPPENYFLNSSNYSDSSLLSVLVFSGIIGLLAFISLFLSYLKSYQALILLSLVFFNSIIINSLFFPVTAFLIYIVLNWENT